jgi:hypothetical protein
MLTFGEGNLPMNYRELVLRTLTEQDAFDFAVECELVSLERVGCQVCEEGLMNTETGKVRKGLDLRLVCNKPTWKNKKSVFEGTIFFRSHIKISQFFSLLYAFAEKKTTIEAGYEAGVSRKTAGKWFNRFEDIITTSSHRLFKLGGRDQIIEVDETLIFKRKNDRGRVLMSSRRYVVGALCRLTSEVRLKVVRRKEKRQLREFLLENVVSTSKVITDEWRGYIGIETLGFRHLTINHSRHFVDPNDRTIHTNGIERLWRSLKEALRNKITENNMEEKVLEFQQSWNSGAKSVAERFYWMIDLNPF